MRKGQLPQTAGRWPDPPAFKALSAADWKTQELLDLAARRVSLGALYKLTATGADRELVEQILAAKGSLEGARRSRVLGVSDLDIRAALADKISLVAVAQGARYSIDYPSVKALVVAGKREQINSLGQLVQAGATLEQAKECVVDGSFDTLKEIIYPGYTQTAIWTYTQALTLAQAGITSQEAWELRGGWWDKKRKDKLTTFEPEQLIDLVKLAKKVVDKNNRYAYGAGATVAALASSLASLEDARAVLEAGWNADKFFSEVHQLYFTWEAQWQADNPQTHANYAKWRKDRAKAMNEYSREAKAQVLARAREKAQKKAIKAAKPNSKARGKASGKANGKTR